MKKRILIVEDEENIREVCKRYLEREEYEVYTAVNGKEGWDLFLTHQPDLIILECQKKMDGNYARKFVNSQMFLLEGWDLFLTHQPDLIILDLMMPKKDGWELCEEIRQQSNVPIIMLTAKGEERDRILGLTMGADDYLTKPFSPRELVLRVQIILRRGSHVPIQAKESLLEVIEFPDLKIYPKTRYVLVCDKEVELTVKEFEVLYLMAKHPKQVFSRSQLLELIWDFGHEGASNTVTVLVSRLREKLKSKGYQTELSC
ncbi:response regulator transcription factor [Bacillus sp. AY3-1]|uniref:response regulator transcription factor n=1 Tax=Bacillus sp. AY3-1 TaxID=2217817 RepID=UPI00351B01A7